MNRYSKILHHLREKPETPKRSSTKKRTFEEYDAEQKKTEVDKLKEQTKELTENIEFLQNLVVNQHDEVYELRQKLKNTPIPQPKNQLSEGLLNEPPNIKNSDPLTPFDQKYVTFQQLSDHYRLFTNRILEQMATVGGGGETQFKYLDDIRNFIFVGTKNDLPPAVNGVINLKDNYTYFFTTTLDLEGDRLVAGQNTTILGGSSENCRIKSTGISTTVALLSSNYSLPLRNITLEAPYAINLDATGYGTQALDWFGVNFTNCAKVGIISSYNNFIMLDGAFLDSQDLTFDGTTGTVGFNQCLFSGDFPPGNPSGKSILNFPSTFICTRRIRVTVCSFIVPPGYTGITVQDGVAFSQPESFILQTCNFSGPGTKLGVSTHTNINNRDSFYEGNRGIQNTFPSGQFYMSNNSTVTSVGSTDTWTKIAGITTTDGSINSKFIATDNRVTYDVAIDRKFLSQATVTFTQDVPASGPFIDFDVEVGIFDYDESVGIGTILKSSATLVKNTTYGQYYTVHLTDIHDHEQGDYVELYIRNKGTDCGILVTDMSLLVTSI
jgi:hypothetical protein